MVIRPRIRTRRSRISEIVFYTAPPTRLVTLGGSARDWSTLPCNQIFVLERAGCTMHSQTVSRNFKHENSEQPYTLAHVADPFLTILRPDCGKTTTLVLRSLNIMLNRLGIPLTERGGQRTETHGFRKRKPQRDHLPAHRRLRPSGSRLRSDGGTNPLVVNRVTTHLPNCSAYCGARPNDCRRQRPANGRRPPQCRLNCAPDGSRSLSGAVGTASQHLQQLPSTVALPPGRHLGLPPRIA